MRKEGRRNKAFHEAPQYPLKVLLGDPTVYLGALKMSPPVSTVTPRGGPKIGLGRRSMASRRPCRGKMVIVKPPTFDDKGSVHTFLAKFENFATYNRWSENDKLRYLMYSLEDSAAYVQWDL